MSQHPNLDSIYRNWHNCQLRLLIILQDSNIISTEAVDEKLKKELDYLYDNLKDDVKITLLNSRISSHEKYSEAISYIIENKPVGLKLMFITSSDFNGEDIQPYELEKKFSNNNISFYQRKDNLINFLSEQDLIKLKTEKEVA